MAKLEDCAPLRGRGSSGACGSSDAPATLVDGAFDADGIVHERFNGLE
jgi:hypothetical protein